MTQSASTVSDGLQITYLPITGGNMTWGDHGDVAWRVAYGWQGELYAHPVPFVRQRDAELAMRALEETGFFHGAPREIVQRMKANGLAAHDIRRTMLESLEW